MTPLELVGLTPLMERTRGKPEVAIGLIDGPVAVDHPELASERIHAIARDASASCTRADGLACLHGTFVAGILSARRASAAPAICPDCTLFVRPIFAETGEAHAETPSATPFDLACAIVDCVEAGARVLNISAGGHVLRGSAARPQPVKVVSCMPPGGD
jgi:subtilisin family serine protease